jgi:benzoylformate decarboxylase
MADGYARATGRTSFVNLHVAAGVANGLIGLLNARRSRTPMVVTAGQQDRRHLLHEPILSGDLVGLARSATKSAIEVQHAADLPLVLRRAFAEAVARRRPSSSRSRWICSRRRSPSRAGAHAATALPATGLDAAVALLAGASNRWSSPATASVGSARSAARRARRGARRGRLPPADGGWHQPPGNHPCTTACPCPPAEIRRRSNRTTSRSSSVPRLRRHHFTPTTPFSGHGGGADRQRRRSGGRNFAVAVGLVGALAPRSAARPPAGRAGAAPPNGWRCADATATARAVTDAEALGRYGMAPMDPWPPLTPSLTRCRRTIVVEEAITSGLLLRRVLRQDRPALVHPRGGLGWGIGAAIGTRMGAHGDLSWPASAMRATFGLQGCGRRAIASRWRSSSTTAVRSLKDARPPRAVAAGTLRRPRSSRTTAGLVGGGRTFGIDTVGPMGAQPRDIAPMWQTIGPLLIEVPVRGIRRRRPAGARVPRIPVVAGWAVAYLATAMGSPQGW